VHIGRGKSSPTSLAKLTVLVVHISSVGLQGSSATAAILRSEMDAICDASHCDQRKRPNVIAVRTAQCSFYKTKFLVIFQQLRVQVAKYSECQSLHFFFLGGGG
jgi:hypothetical protein